MKQGKNAVYGILPTLLVLALLSTAFVPAHAAGNEMGTGHDEDESYGVQGMMTASSSGGMQATLPLIYGLFAVVIILVLVILYIVFVRQRKIEPVEDWIQEDFTGCDSDYSHEAGFPPELKTNYTDPTLIGRGGLSSVYSVTSKETDETVAVKIPSGRDERSGKVFLQEIKIWENLDHPNIVSLKSVNVFPVPYVEMEYIPDSLEKIEQPVDKDVALAIASGVLRGLSYAHKKGVVHCDIKPANILINDEFTPKITDWGVGRHLRTEKDSEFQGYTPAFAAPEQISRDGSGCTEKTDIFQTGMLIIRMICGKVAFEMNYGRRPESYISDCINDERLAVVLARCIEEEPERRPRSADELLYEIMAMTGNTVMD